MKTKKLLTVLVLVIGIYSNLFAQSNEVYSTNGIAINGYDPVAYFTAGKPVQGSDSFIIKWNDVQWLFTSKENADKFKLDPVKYSPQYGGYCAYGCSSGYKAKTSADAWSIVDGKLYLNYNKDVRNAWSKEQEKLIKKADANWPTVKTTKF